MDERVQLPRMQTIRQIARTGVLPEHALRLLVKSGQIPCLRVGTRQLINFDRLLDYLERL